MDKISHGRYTIEFQYEARVKSVGALKLLYHPHLLLAYPISLPEKPRPA